MTRRVLLPLALIALCAGPAFPDDPAPHAPPDPVHDQIRLPEPASPVLPPAPSPNAPTVLNADELYVFDSDVECFVAGYPAGLLKVTAEKGPVKVKARFAGNTQTSTRSFKGPFVYTVEAVQTGDATLVVTPKGVDSAAKILTRLIEANAGPRPPPMPPAPPQPPTPPVPADPLSAPLAAAFVADGSPVAAAKALAAVYRQSTAATDNTALATLEDLLTVLHAAGQSVAPDPVLGKTRRVIADELNVKIGRTPSQPLDAATRATAKAQFARMAALLEVLK